MILCGTRFELRDSCFGTIRLQNLRSEFCVTKESSRKRTHTHSAAQFRQEPLQKGVCNTIVKFCQNPLSFNAKRNYQFHRFADFIPQIIINSTDSPISFHRFADFIPQIRRFHSTDSPISFFSERFLCGCDTVCCRDVSPVGKLRKNFIHHTLFPAEPLCTHPVAQVCFQFTMRPLVYL